MKEVYDLVTKLKSIHYTFDIYLDQASSRRDWDGLQKYMSTFIGKDYDLNYLKTLLVISKGLKENTFIKEVRNKIWLEYKTRMEEKGLIPY